MSYNLQIILCINLKAQDFSTEAYVIGPVSLFLSVSMLVLLMLVCVCVCV